MPETQWALVLYKLHTKLITFNYSYYIPFLTLAFYTECVWYRIMWKKWERLESILYFVATTA